MIAEKRITTNIPVVVAADRKRVEFAYTLTCL